VQYLANETRNGLRRVIAKKQWLAVYLCLLASLVLCSCASQAPVDDAIANGVIDLYSKTLTAYALYAARLQLENLVFTDRIMQRGLPDKTEAVLTRNASLAQAPRKPIY
jgi:hypothetical protein